MAKKFVNTSKRREPQAPIHEYHAYGYDKISPYLFYWSVLLQKVVSQAGTWLLTGRFHDHECGIYKTEGGVHIVGVGELALLHKSCRFDGGGSHEQTRDLAEMITKIVLAFDPNDPIESLYKAGSSAASCKKAALVKAVEGSHAGGVFGGDALSALFDHNPFSDPPNDCKYRRFILTKFCGKSSQEVDQIFSDEDLGKDLHKRLREAVKARGCSRGWVNDVYCCSPRRTQDGLGFWVNTGRKTQIDGWKTHAELEKFLNSNDKFVDTATY